MAAQAKLSRSWINRMVIIIIVLVGYGLWCMRDATVKYPAHNLRVAAFAHLQNEFPGTLWDDQHNPIGWTYDRSAEAEFDKYADYKTYAEAKGWPPDKPGAPKMDSDVGSQWTQLYVCAGIAALCLIWTLYSGVRRVGADDEGIVCAGGCRVRYNEIKSIDKSRWDAKSIAVVHYEQNGKAGSIKLDEWKYQGARDVLEEIEKHTGPAEESPPEPPKAESSTDEPA